MGRCNNRRTQQAAAQLRNTPSRARFSKGPPKKNTRGGKRGGKGGGGNNRKESVVKKIAKRVEEKSKTSTGLIVKTKRHPLDGIDISLLDEIKLSDASIQLVTKLLQDLNIMESYEGKGIEKEEEAKDQKEDDSVEFVESDDGFEEDTIRKRNVGTGGYIEYEDDMREEEELKAFNEYIPTVSCSEEKIEAEDDDDNNDNDDDDDDSETERIKKTPLFQHLTSKLSFSHENATKACLGIENWKISAKSNKDESSLNSEKLSLAMDWLCLHMSDKELTEGFKINQNSSILQRAIPLVGTGRTRAIPHKSISIARPITSDNEWKENVRREARKVGFLRMGFSSLEYEKAFDEAPDVQAKNSEDDEGALRVILTTMEKEVLGDNSELPNVEQISKADIIFAKEEQEDEIQALEAIFDEQLEKISNDGTERLVITITPIEDLRSPASSTSCKLHVFDRPGYPVISPPLLLFTNPSLPPSLLRKINMYLIQKSHELIGEAAVFSLVDFLSTNLHEWQIDFIKEQRTKEMEANQLKMRLDAGHDINISNVDDYEDGKLGRRQRAKLKAEEKAYNRPEQLKLLEEERRRKQDARVDQAKSEMKQIRFTLAEKAIQDRERQRVENEAEKAARAALNKALNEGKPVAEARVHAEEARNESLRYNGVDVGLPEKESEEIDGENDEAKETKNDCVEEDLDANENNSSLEQKSTSQTSAFMERLRAYYNKAAEMKSKLNNAAETVSAKNNSEESYKDIQIVLDEPKNTESINVSAGELEKIHVPAPVPIPSGELSDVMKGVMEVQREQPWLISPEARVPNQPVVDTISTETENYSMRDEKSSRLREELERKYKAAEKVGANSDNRRSKISKSESISVNFYRMLCQRRRLPAYKMKDIVIQTVEQNQVCVVSGDTGCGKTTQVPQLILDDLIWKGRGAEANMIVTQPRRISAIGVSERVAAERCEKVGETAGYSIRLENKRSSKTRILLCTTGILLRRLQCDPDLASVSHIFVDEVHERDINTDFLLIILKDLLARRKGLKLILMSATLNAEAFSSYFGGCAVVSIPGRAFPVTENRLEDILKLTNYEVQPDSDCAYKSSDKPSGEAKQPRFSKSKLRQMYYPKYPTSVISSLAILDETIINYELLARLLEEITINNDEGAILVFMPGMGEITKAIEELYKKEFFQSSQVVIYPLHSSLSTLEQTAVFEVPPKGVRKIVVSTNIAETSITIEDVVYVVDCGRVKENRKDELNELPTLVETWVSRASAKQRRGRAGRVRPGIAYHLYSSHTYESDMQEYQLPEMLRVGLEDLVLQILLLDLGEPCSFLAKAVNPPSALAMRNSLKLLEGLGAVEVQWNAEGSNTSQHVHLKDGAIKNDDTCLSVVSDSGLTALGFHLASLPVDPRVGKMMIYGALFGCTDPALTIAASMSARSPFMSPFDKRDEADEARQMFATEGSDPLTTLTAFQEWKKMRRTKGNSATNKFLRDSFLSRLTLFQMEDLRKQFANLLTEIGFLPEGFRIYSHATSNKKGVSERCKSANANANSTALVKAVLCAGLYPNIIVAPRSLAGDRPGNQEAGELAFRGLKGDVHLHPSTISFSSKHLDSRYCCYHEIVKTSKIYVRDCTTVSPFALLLFGGSLKVHHSRNVATVDEWLKFRIGAKPATLVKHLRAQMETLLLQKIVNPQEDITGSAEGQALITAVSTLLENEKSQLKLPDGAEIVRPWTRNNQNSRYSNGRQSENGGRGGRSGKSGRSGRGR